MASQLVRRLRLVVSQNSGSLSLLQRCKKILSWDPFMAFWKKGKIWEYELLNKTCKDHTCIYLADCVAHMSKDGDLKSVGY